MLASMKMTNGCKNTSVKELRCGSDWSHAHLLWEEINQSGYAFRGARAGTGKTASAI